MIDVRTQRLGLRLNAEERRLDSAAKPARASMSTPVAMLARLAVVRRG